MPQRVWEVIHLALWRSQDGTSLLLHSHGILRLLANRSDTGFGMMHRQPPSHATSLLTSAQIRRVCSYTL